MTAPDRRRLAGGGAPGPVPSPFTLEELLKVRGPLFSMRAPGGFVMNDGCVQSLNPQQWIPNTMADVIDSCEFSYGHYDQAREDMFFATWKAHPQYRHACVGPIRDVGYHGLFKPFDLRDNPKRFIAQLEKLIDRRIVPVFFAGGDNMTLAEMQTYESIFRDPAFQRVVPWVLPKGFEPSADTPNAEYVAWYEWKQRVFPSALSGLHMVANMDCPGNNDDLTPGRPGYIGPAECWRRLAGMLHAFFGQYGPFTSNPGADPDQVNEWRKVFIPNRFKDGTGGTPQFSAFGPNVPIKHIGAEYDSFSVCWKGYPENWCRAWGDIALAAGADGVMDGCS